MGSLSISELPPQSQMRIDLATDPHENVSILLALLHARVRGGRRPVNAAVHGVFVQSKQSWVPEAPDSGL
jgi:hypothetical protein